MVFNCVINIMALNMTSGILSCCLCFSSCCQNMNYFNFILTSFVFCSILMQKQLQPIPFSITAFYRSNYTMELFIESEVSLMCIKAWQAVTNSQEIQEQKIKTVLSVINLNVILSLVLPITKIRLCWAQKTFQFEMSFLKISNTEELITFGFNFSHAT